MRPHEAAESVAELEAEVARVRRVASSHIAAAQWAEARAGVLEQYANLLRRRSDARSGNAGVDITFR